MHPTLAAYEIPPAPFAKGGVFACDAGASGLHSHASAWERGLSYSRKQKIIEISYNWQLTIHYIGYKGYFKMIAQTMTLEQVRQVGIDVLTQQLGCTGMIRFLQQSETGWGDYTKDKEQWLGNPPLDELFDAIQRSEMHDEMI